MTIKTLKELNNKEVLIKLLENKKEFFLTSEYYDGFIYQLLEKNQIFPDFSYFFNDLDLEKVKNDFNNTKKYNFVNGCFINYIIKNYNLTLDETNIVYSFVSSYDESDVMKKITNLDNPINNKEKEELSNTIDQIKVDTNKVSNSVLDQENEFLTRLKNISPILGVKNISYDLLKKYEKEIINYFYNDDIYYDKKISQLLINSFDKLNIEEKESLSGYYNRFLFLIKEEDLSSANMKKIYINSVKESQDVKNINIYPFDKNDKNDKLFLDNIIKHRSIDLNDILKLKNINDFYSDSFEIYKKLGNKNQLKYIKEKDIEPNIKEIIDVVVTEKDSYKIDTFVNVFEKENQILINKILDSNYFYEKINALYLSKKRIFDNETVLNDKDYLYRVDQDLLNKYLNGLLKSFNNETNKDKKEAYLNYLSIFSEEYGLEYLRIQDKEELQKAYVSGLLSFKKNDNSLPTDLEYQLFEANKNIIINDFINDDSNILPKPLKYSDIMNIFTKKIYINSANINEKLFEHLDKNVFKYITNTLSIDLLKNFKLTKNDKNALNDFHKKILNQVDNDLENINKNYSIFMYTNEFFYYLIDNKIKMSKDLLSTYIELSNDNRYNSLKKEDINKIINFLKTYDKKIGFNKELKELIDKSHLSKHFIKLKQDELLNKFINKINSVKNIENYSSYKDEEYKSLYNSLEEKTLKNYMNKLIKDKNINEAVTLNSYINIIPDIMIYEGLNKNDWLNLLDNDKELNNFFKILPTSYDSKSRIIKSIEEYKNDEKFSGTHSFLSSANKIKSPIKIDLEKEDVNRLISKLKKYNIDTNRDSERNNMMFLYYNLDKSIVKELLMTENQDFLAYGYDFNVDYNISPKEFVKFLQDGIKGSLFKSASINVNTHLKDIMSVVQINSQEDIVDLFNYSKEDPLAHLFVSLYNNRYIYQNYLERDKNKNKSIDQIFHDFIFNLIDVDIVAEGIKQLKKLQDENLKKYKVKHNVNDKGINTFKVSEYESVIASLIYALEYETNNAKYSNMKNEDTEKLIDVLKDNYPYILLIKSNIANIKLDKEFFENEIKKDQKLVFDYLNYCPEENLPRYANVDDLIYGAIDYYIKNNELENLSFIKYLLEKDKFPKVSNYRYEPYDEKIEIFKKKIQEENKKSNFNEYQEKLNAYSEKLFLSIVSPKEFKEKKIRNNKL